MVPHEESFLYSSRLTRNFIYFLREWEMAKGIGLGFSHRFLNPVLEFPIIKAANVY